MAEAYVGDKLGIEEHPPHRDMFHLIEKVWGLMKQKHTQTVSLQAFMNCYTTGQPVSG